MSDQQKDTSTLTLTYVLPNGQRRSVVGFDDCPVLCRTLVYKAIYSLPKIQYIQYTMKTFIAASLIASAAAFAPVSDRATTSSALNAASPFADEIGAQVPLGYFDPLGICKDGNRENFDRLRYVELKHGRVAMLAVVGYLVTYAGVRFPGAEDIPSGWAALSATPPAVWAQMAFTFGIMEAFNRDASDVHDIPPGEFKGDFRNSHIDFGWDKQTDAWKRNKRAIELNQGRAAQMGILGLMVHDAMGNVKDILP